MVEFDAMSQWLDRVESQIEAYVKMQKGVQEVITFADAPTADEVKQRYPSSRPQTKRIAVAPHWTRRLTAKQRAKLFRSSYRTPFYLLEIIKNNRWNRSTLNKVDGRFERWEEQG